MRQFINRSDQAFKDLEERAKWDCIRFRQQELPPGCLPNRTDIGFEIDHKSGAAKLLVSLGVRYTGQNTQIGQWLAAGHKEFGSFAELKDWIRGSLAVEFRNNTSTNIYAANTDHCNPPNAASITDIRVVHEAMKEINRPLYLDEDNLFNELRKRVLGQDKALKSLSAVMARHCARRRPKRPAVIFAVGPSGVGKTRSAEALSEVLRNMDTADMGYGFLRLDMNEYQEKHRISQLIGAPQGYIGHGEGSQLVDTLRANPHTILLFDEIEKSHPAILKVLMNAMDAGRLSTADRSSAGREIDCRLAAFIFTSNLDAKEIIDELTTRNAFGNRAIEDDVCRRRLHATGIAPEIIGRIGRFLVFRPLSPEIRAEIIAMAIVEIAEEYGVEVSYVEPDVIIDILKRVHSQNFGVRPERFIIDDLLGGLFAKAARQNIQNPIKVVGPPFKCEVIVDGSNAPSEQIQEPATINKEEQS